MRSFLLLLGLVAAVSCGCATRSPSIVYTHNSTEVIQTNVIGSYVAQAFSRSGNKLYQGRSYTSTAEALARAVASCPYSDCNAFAITAHDACVAFAIKNEQPRRWGKAPGKTPEEATAIAVKYCNAPSLEDTCYPVAVLCPEY